MDDLLALIVFVLFIAGGSCSLAGTWWYRNKKKGEIGGEGQDGEK